MEQKAKDELKNEIALFRYGLIAPVITNTYTETSKMEYFRTVASKSYIVNGKEEHFSCTSIKKWYLNYRRDGFKALMPKTRNDYQTSRKLNEEVQEKIKDFKNNYPHITGTLIYNKLVDVGFINPNDISLGTVLKFIRDNKLLFNETENIDRRAFVMEHANDCWQADTSHGPYLTIDGKKVLTYLIAIIDDASRKIVGAKFFFNDNNKISDEILDLKNESKILIIEYYEADNDKYFFICFF